MNPQQIPIAEFSVNESTDDVSLMKHTACDKNGYVMGVNVTAGNVHDSVAFAPLCDELVGKFPEISVIAADSAYKTAWICKKLTDMGIVLSAPYTRNG